MFDLELNDVGKSLYFQWKLLNLFHMSAELTLWLSGGFTGTVIANGPSQFQMCSGLHGSRDN